MSLKEHALRELRFAEASPDSNFHKHVMAMVERAEAFGLDEGDMRVLASAFYQLAMGEVLNPLTGSDEEWEVVEEDKKWRNVRCPRVLKEVFVGAYDTMGIIFVDDQDRQFVKDPQSRMAVTFPYNPQSRYVRVKTGPDLILPHGIKSLRRH